MGSSVTLMTFNRKSGHSASKQTTVVKVQNGTEPGEQSIVPSALPRYWSWTFCMVSAPFFIWGCPFYLLISKQSPEEFPIRSTGAWFKRIFNCRSPLSCILSVILLIPTVLVNVYILYVFGDFFDSLFISGKYEMSAFEDFLEFFRYMPILLPLDYVWIRGFNINNVVCHLNHIYQTNGGVGCRFRGRLLVMLLVLVCLHTIRYISYEKYYIGGRNFWATVEVVAEFSLDIFCSFLLPVYCTFCYAIKFQLLAIKAIIYKSLSKRVPPDVSHLEKVKVLYTNAADLIINTNSLFSLYLSFTIIITITGTVWDAENLWEGLSEGISYLFGGGSFIWSFLIGLISGMGNSKGSGPPWDTSANATDLKPSDVREINADILCIVITYGMIFFTVWQAVGTNDTARELHVWLNDFVTGGGGTDIKGILTDLGALGNEERVGVGELQTPLVWGGNLFQDGVSDEFLKKFQLLKSYIHVRMQIEKPALLHITLVGLLVPTLSGRLRQYNLRF